VDGYNSVGEAPFPDDKELIVVDRKTIAQLWEEQKPKRSIIAEPGQTIDIDALNAETPTSEWELGFDGVTPKPPWQLNTALYMLDETKGQMYTMIGATVGLKMAVKALCEKTRYLRKLRGRVAPVVTVGHTKMKTRWGSKARPDFKVVAWKTLGDAPQQPLLKTVAPPTSGEIVNDEIPDHPAKPFDDSLPAW